jgi:hypothetical protein
MTSTLQRYQYIALLHDLLDLPFEHRRYRRIRLLVFDRLPAPMTGGSMRSMRRLLWQQRTNSGIIGIPTGYQIGDTE